jgi:hypothetical protein
VFVADSFKKLTDQLCNDDASSFSSTFATLVKTFPKCEPWIRWYTRRSKRAMAFPVGSTLVLVCLRWTLTMHTLRSQKPFSGSSLPQNWKSLPSSSNASESIGADIKKSSKPKAFGCTGILARLDAAWS